MPLIGNHLLLTRSLHKFRLTFCFRKINVFQLDPLRPISSNRKQQVGIGVRKKEMVRILDISLDLLLDKFSRRVFYTVFKPKYIYPFRQLRDINIGIQSPLCGLYCFYQLPLNIVNG